MTTRQELLNRLRGLKGDFVGKYPIARLCLFGLVVRDEQAAGSDADLVVEFNGRMGSKFFDLADELEAQLGIKFYLVSFRGIKPGCLQAIKPERPMAQAQGVSKPPDSRMFRC